MRRAHQHTLQGAGHIDVRHVSPAAEQKAPILDAPQGRADALRLRIALIDPNHE
jgi:hypothetical protein